MALFFLGGCSLTRALLYYPQKLSQSRLDHIRNTFEDVSEIKLSTQDGQTLHGWLLRKDLQQLPILVYFGGNGEEVSFNLEFFAEKAAANVLLLNYRGYGLSTGSPSEKKLKNDAELIYDHLLTHYPVKADQVIPIGRSLGSGIALYLAAQKGLNKVILVTPYDSIRSVAYDYFPNFLVRWALADTYETESLCQRFQGQMLILTAAQDEVIHPSHAQRLCAAYATNLKKRFIMIPATGHNDIHINKRYWQAIGDFL